MEKMSGILVMNLPRLVIFGVDNSSSSHTDNCKDDILMLVEDSFSINGNFGALEKKV